LEFDPPEVTTFKEDFPIISVLVNGFSKPGDGLSYRRVVFPALSRPRSNTVADLRYRPSAYRRE